MYYNRDGKTIFARVNASFMCLYNTQSRPSSTHLQKSDSPLSHTHTHTHTFVCTHSLKQIYTQEREGTIHHYGTERETSALTLVHASITDTALFFLLFFFFFLLLRLRLGFIVFTRLTTAVLAALFVFGRASVVCSTRLLRTRWHEVAEHDSDREHC